MIADRFIAEEKLLQARNRSRAIGLIEMDEDFDPCAVDSSTAYGYLSMLKVHIRPKWGSSPISEVKPALVQQWLRDMDVVPKTKGHIKALLHKLFEKAMLWELLPVDRNPMQLVRIRGISKRTKKPIVLTADQCAALISQLPDPYWTMVMVAICTGLRVSEILALRWSRVDLDGLTMSVKVKAVNGRVGRVKTECSEDDVPLDLESAGLLRRWKEQRRDTPGD
jgi:integrase